MRVEFVDVFKQPEVADRYGVSQIPTQIFFDDLRVPAENLIGEEGMGFYYIMESFQLERLVAAILFVVAWNMSEVKHFAKMVRRAPHADVAILLVTFGLTVLADLVVAVSAGVARDLRRYYGREALVIPTDVTQREQVDALVAETIARANHTTAC